MKFFVITLGKKLQVAGKEELIFRFTGGAHCNLNEVCKFGICVTTATFGNICRDRHTRMADL